MKIIQRAVPGTLTSSNKGSLKWGSRGLIAYGANTMVAVVDSCTLQHITTLHAHRSPVTKISWAPTPLPADDNERPIYLASADTTGFIVVFDVTAGKDKQRLCEANKVVNAIEMFYSNSTDLLLLSLHQTALLILWNPLTGEQLWKKSFTEALGSFTRDPFNSSCLVLNGGGFIQYVTDFSASHAPSDGTRFFLSSGQTEPMSPTAGSTEKSNKRTSVLFDIPRRSRLMLQSDRSNKSSASIDDESQLLNLLSVFYHKTRRNTLILLYAQDILILDLDIKQTISIVSLERSTCPFLEVYPCRYRDAMYCLHDNGTVVFRVKKPTSPSDSAAAASSTLPEFLYESTCSSDGMRITKSQKVFGLAVCPSSELKTAVVTSEGKLLIWELRDEMKTKLTDNCRPVMSLSDILRPSTCGGNMLTEDTHKCSFMLTGITNSLAHAPFVLKMCPPLTTKNFHLYQPYVAIGSVNGVVHIYDIRAGSLVRDLTVHSCQIRGIEWTSLHSMVTHACESLNGSQGKSELAFINIKTGKVINFRTSKPDEGVIQMVRVSYLKQYMVIVFKNKPMELWELKTLTLLREMPNKFPVITSLEWSPSAFKKKVPGGDGHDNLSRFVCEESNQYYPGIAYYLGKCSLSDDMNFVIPHHMVKEHFVFTDNTNLLHHYIVEGSIIKDGSTINAQGVSGTVTSMAWKNELLILGDVNSNLSFWDLKVKKSVNMAISKGMVRKIRMAPGKENTKILILFNEELQIWDKNAKEVLSSLKFPKTIGRVNDADWAASDKLVLSIADGYVAITDVSLKQFMSRLDECTDNGDRSLLCLAPRGIGLALQYKLNHQPWCETKVLPDKIDIPLATRDYLMSEGCKVDDRCLIAAHICGDEFAIDFWTVASYYLNKMKREKWRHVKTPTSDRKEELDLFVPTTPTIETEKSIAIETSDNSSINQLESNFDVICSNETFKRAELSRVSLQSNKKYGSATRLECARRYILLGESDKAVHLLLESESDSSTFYSDSLRACLLATVRTSGASQSTLKLVATSLIANGKLSEGVELLCLIDKGLDACRYLQTYGHWDEAVWLSKVTLTHKDTAEVITRWINEHLSSPSVNAKGQAVLASMSIGNLMKAVELLYGMQCFSLCAMFIEACTELELLELTDQTLPIIEAVYLQYARLLKSADIIDGALHYCKKAGEQGSQLLTELETSSSENN